MEAEPSAPRADLRTRAGHAAGKVLEMADGVAEVAVISTRGGFHDPDEGAVG